MQERVYERDPSWHRTLSAGLLIAALLCLFAIILILSRTNAKFFVISLNLFFIVNIVSWLLTKRLVRRVIDASRHVYSRESNDTPKLVQINVVDQFMTGNWHWNRFIVLIFILMSIDVVTYSVRTQEFLHKLIAYGFSDDLAGTISVFFY
jgi:hypothetical protein